MMLLLWHRQQNRYSALLRFELQAQGPSPTLRTTRSGGLQKVQEASSKPTCCYWRHVAALGHKVCQGQAHPFVQRLVDLDSQLVLASFNQHATHKQQESTLV